MDKDKILNMDPVKVKLVKEGWGEFIDKLQTSIDELQNDGCQVIDISYCNSYLGSREALIVFRPKSINND